MSEHKKCVHGAKLFCTNCILLARRQPNFCGGILHHHLPLAQHRLDCRRVFRQAVAVVKVVIRLEAKASVERLEVAPAARNTIFRQQGALVFFGESWTTVTWRWGWS